VKHSNSAREESQILWKRTLWTTGRCFFTDVTVLDGGECLARL